jgi:hypothetical protein
MFGLGGELCQTAETWLNIAKHFLRNIRSETWGNLL